MLQVIVAAVVTFEFIFTLSSTDKEFSFGKTINLIALVP